MVTTDIAHTSWDLNMSQSEAMDVDQDLSSFIFHHIFFPLKLPQEAESNLAQLENRMIVVVRSVLQDFVQNVSPESQQRWALARNMLGSWIELHGEQGISQLGLDNALSKIKITGKLIVFFYISRTWILT